MTVFHAEGGYACCAVLQIFLLFIMHLCMSADYAHRKLIHKLQGIRSIRRFATKVDMSSYKTAEHSGK